MRINRWWDADPDERYWLETTDRTDLGVDLNAPQRDERGGRWSYSLILEISEGDVILHYHRPAGAIVAWSRAVGAVWEDEVIWAAHGTSARSRHVIPYPRPGWRLGLEGPFELTRPVTAEEIETRAPELRRI